LMGLATTENVPWSYVQIEIDHHIEELDLIRSSQDSRIQALLGLYAYLRDGVSKIGIHHRCNTRETWMPWLCVEQGPREEIRCL
jgi:hypothetical protein